MWQAPAVRYGDVNPRRASAVAGGRAKIHCPHAAPSQPQAPGVALHLVQLKKVGIPRSLPYFFGSLKVAITLAFVGAVVSETVGANKGIGKLMLDAQAAFQVPIVFAGLLVLAMLGILLYAATALIEKRFTGWAFRGQSAQ